MNLMVVVSSRHPGVTDKPRAAVWQARLFTPKKLLLKCFALALALSTAQETLV